VLLGKIGFAAGTTLIMMTKAEETVVATVAAVRANADEIENVALPEAFALGTADVSALAPGASKTNRTGKHGRTPEAGSLS
jgi:undecaprenyl pyrophosphate phosphatase UppP